MIREDKGDYDHKFIRVVSVVSPGLSCTPRSVLAIGTGSIPVSKQVRGVHKSKAPELRKRAMPSSHLESVLYTMVQIPGQRSPAG